MTLNSVQLFSGAGLVEVDYTVPANLPVGSYAIELDPSQTEVFDDNNVSLPLTINNGGITIVPEPTAFQLLMLLTCLIGSVRHGIISTR